jgi:hypothetical protein
MLSKLKNIQSRQFSGKAKYQGIWSKSLLNLILYLEISFKLVHLHHTDGAGSLDGGRVETTTTTTVPATLGGEGRL